MRRVHQQPYEPKKACTYYGRQWTIEANAFCISHHQILSCARKFLFRRGRRGKLSTLEDIAKAEDAIV